ncbi:formate hydrogenlyase regulator HycA [Hafnia paralvei]|uniref:formate hydrogenlyase regulator HycA n=1 Tax=Hafnia paralvei TaxID=546367 RepID=UPI001034F4AA|nr:formate hydrogenlyase regulator HycA [Hafnia paralvei]TBM04706.1 formate hydrogenlyase regulator HycA [Hafnia paralvei]
MKVSELTEKSLYIHDKNEKLMAQWALYKSSLIKAATSSKLKIFHEFSCGDGDSVNFTVFDHFMVEVKLADEFYSKKIQYGLRMNDQQGEDHFVEISHSTIDENGLIDGTVNNRSMDAVLEHYLDKIHDLYETLYQAMNTNQPVRELLVGKLGAH